MVNLLDVSHSEAERLVATGAPVYLTVNPVEYHGPHLSLHNDRLVSRGLLRDLHARLQKRHPDWPLLIADDLEIGVEPCPGIGSRHTSFGTACELVREACRALAELGAQRVVLMTFHGAPLHNLALEEGVELLTQNGVRAVSPFNWVLREQLSLDGNRHAAALAHVTDEAERAIMLRDLKFDFHAGFFETSMALYYAPDSVAPTYRELPPCPAITPDMPFVYASRAARSMGSEELANELELASVARGWNAMRPFYGYTGRPHHATAASGELFAREILDQYEPGVEAVLDGREKSPKPIMSWIAVATLGGRLAGMQVPIEEIFRFSPS